MRFGLTVSGNNDSNYRQSAYITIIALFFIFSGCKGNTHENSKIPSPPVTLVKGATFEIITLTSIPETVDVTGTVRAHTSAIVSVRVPGTITLMRVREGDRVRRGQLLAQLDAGENLAAAAGARAGVNEAESALDEAMARKKLAEVTFERYHRLFTEQAVTRQEFDTRKTEREVAEQVVARAKAHLKQSREGASAASTIAGYTKVTAPITGVITARQADMGATMFPGQPLMTIEDDGNYQLELSVPENLAIKIKPGTNVRISLDAVNSNFDGKIAEIVPSADSATRSFIAKVPVNQKGVRSGMFGRGSINLPSVVYGIKLPRTAVVEHGSLTSVIVVSNDGIAHMRLIKTGKITGSEIEIISGLSKGERVMTSGMEKVSEGSRIE